MAAHDEWVALLTAEARERVRCRREGRAFSPLVSPDRRRRLHQQWLEAARQIALRGWQPPPVEQVVALVKERATSWPERYGLPEFDAHLSHDELLFVNVGVGQDSTAIVVLYVLGLLPPWMYRHRVTFAFADTGAEKPETYRYAEDHLGPFLERYGHRLLWLRPGSRYHVTRTGTVTLGLRETYMRDANPSFPMWNSRARCTSRHKQAVLARLREEIRLDWNGRTAFQQGQAGFRDWVVVGIAAEEAHRVEPTRARNYHCVYPLYAMGLDREDCQRIIRAAGLPVPMKSGCTCCYAAPIWERWWLSQVHPDVFARDVALERAQIENRLARGLKPNYMTLGYDLPLDQAVQRWHEENPQVTVEMVEEWLFTRHYSRDDKPRPCRRVPENQLVFNLDALCASD